jgi:hypothetical protein
VTAMIRHREVFKPAEWSASRSSLPAIVPLKSTLDVYQIRVAL